MRLIPPGLLAAAALLSACSSSQEPTGAQHVCYHVAPMKGGKLSYNELVKNMPNLENCAARLEGLRLDFMGRTGRSELMGAYNSSFLFLDRNGVTSSKTLDGPRYLALVRTGDGRLAIPGAMPQP